MSEVKWRPDLNKNQLRENIRKCVNELVFVYVLLVGKFSPKRFLVKCIYVFRFTFVESGVTRIVDQLVNPRINTVLVPKVEDIVCEYVGLPRTSIGSRSSAIKEKEDDKRSVGENADANKSQSTSEQNSSGNSSVVADKPRSEQKVDAVKSATNGKTESRMVAYKSGNGDKQPNPSELSGVKTETLDVESKCRTVKCTNLRILLLYTNCGYTVHHTKISRSESLS